MRALGLPIDKAPCDRGPGDGGRHLTAEAALHCGLVPGIPIAAGLGDTAAARLARASYNRASFWMRRVPAAASAGGHRPIPAGFTRAHPIVMRGAVEDCGSRLPISPAVACCRGSRPRSPRGRRARRGRFRALGGGVGGDSGLFGRGPLHPPTWTGVSYPAIQPCEGRVGLDRHHTWRHLGRAVLESVAYEYAGYLRVLRALHPDLTPSETRVIGGGAHGRLWNSIKSSVLAVPYLRWM